MTPLAIAPILLLSLSACTSGPRSVVPTALAITNAQIVDVDSGELRVDHTILMRDGRIRAIGPTSRLEVPSSVPCFDASGAYAIPGLADMHVHLPRGDEPGDRSLGAYFDLLLAAGVTTVRSMRGTDGDIDLREQLAQGRRDGPRLIAGSPTMDGANATDPTTARRLVRRFAIAGFDFLKITEGMDRATFEAILDEARKTGCPLAGHVPDLAGIEEILAAYRTIEHLHRHGGVSSRSPERLPELARATAETAVWICPTLAFQVSWYAQASLSELEQWPGIEHAHADALAMWRKRAARQHALARRDPDRNERRMAANYATVRALRDAGVKLLVSASRGWFLVPGFSMFVEMRCLAKAGLTPIEILRAATSNAARSLGQPDQWGTLRVGLAADIVLLAADPRADIRNVERVVAVVRRGRLHDRSELDRRLRAATAP